MEFKGLQINLIYIFSFFFIRYQERVIEKLKRQEAKSKPTHKLPRLTDTSRWMFLKDGLDDFRDGFLPEVEDIFIRRNVCVYFFPNLFLVFFLESVSHG